MNIHCEHTDGHTYDIIEPAHRHPRFFVDGMEVTYNEFARSMDPIVQLRQALVS